ncbi:hypothetical protein [Flavobacterium covae]
MKNLEIIQNENSKQAVLCSQLFRGLELDASNYGYWIKKNIINNPFAIEGEDFAPLNSLNVRISASSNPLNSPKDGLRNKRLALSIKNYEISVKKTNSTYPKGNLTKKRKRDLDFVLSLDFAKCLAMLRRTEIGN